MEIRTQRRLLNIGNRQQRVVSLAIAPRSSSGYLGAGIALGLVFGFILGTVLAFSLGDKSISFAQDLWNRIFNVDADGERVRFELLLQ